MDPLCRATAPGARFPFRRLALTVAAGLLFGSSSYAATFGHSRIASGVGEPLVIKVPVSGLSAQDIQSLSAQVAPAADWAQAGLVPPVALDGMRVSVEPGVQSATRVLRVQSSQALEGTLVDLLIDVHTASGQQRYQVTLIANGSAQAPRPVTGTQGANPATTSTTAVGQSAHSSARRVPGGSIAVRKGDTMFAIAHRHAVEGVTVYQMMMALQRTTPEAFIEKNINLVKAGERLAVPGMSELLALSDRDARREFQAQAAAFAAYRARHGGAQAASLVQSDQNAAAQGSVTSVQRAAAAPSASGDHLRLSGASAQGARSAQAQADTHTAQTKAMTDAQGRVSQLEENVGHLSEALKAQGEAARNAVVGGAKDLGDSLSDVADAVSQASRDAAAESGDASMGASTNTSARALASTSASADGAAATGSTASGAAAASTSGVSAQSAASAVPGASTSSSLSAPTGMAQGSASSTNPPTDSMAQPISPKAEETVSWLQEHLLGVMTALLALIVLIIAWLLRRANNNRDDAYDGAPITDAMVREKLRNIDLDLTPGTGEASQQKG